MGEDVAHGEVLATPRIARAGSRSVHPIAVFSEWRGKAFYLNVQYRARSRKPEDDFVVRHTDDAHRLRQIRPGVLSAHGQVVHLYRGLTAAECFREIEENEIFWPTT